MYTLLYTIRRNHIFAYNLITMVLVSSREFRANQRKYLDMARSKDVVITSRSHGNYRLVPIADSDIILDSSQLEARISRGIAEFEQGKAEAISKGESIDEYLNRLIAEP